MGALYSKLSKHRYFGPMAHTLNIWHKANRRLGWENTITKATPLWYAQQLGQLCHSKGFDKWDAIGISVVGDLLHKGKILTFPALQAKYSLASSEYFRYRQIHHALLQQIPDIQNIPEYSPLEDRLILDPMPKKAISLTYRKLCNNLPNPFLTLREKWTSDLGQLDDEDWQQALMSPKEVAINCRFKLIQLKVLHRIYRSGALLARIGTRSDANCLRNCLEEGTFFHILWECSSIQVLWGAVSEKMQTALGKSIHLTPRLGLLNIWEDTDLTSIEKQWAALGFVVVKRLIAMYWGSQQRPLLTQWLTEMDRCMVAEKDVFRSRGCPKKMG